MPIIDGHVEYEIPKDIKTCIPDYFYIALAGELCSILGPQILEKQTTEEDGIKYYDFDSGTGAWDEAFNMTCRKLNMSWLSHYRDSLEWYDSDRFDGQIEVGIIKHFCEAEPSHSNAYYKYLCWANGKESNEEALLQITEDLATKVEEPSDGNISSSHRMNRTKRKIIALLEDTENGAAGEFVRGWNLALGEVLKLF